MLTIFRRELGAYFNSAIAAIFLIVFVLFSNGLFMLQFFQIGKADMRAFFFSLPFILNIFIPAIAMRLWTEDKKGNTFELLLTFPMRPHQLVLGKFLAGLVFYLAALATTLTIPLMLSWVGRLDTGTVIGGYLGAVFLGALFLSIGIFISGLCKDQIVAFILTVVFTFAAFFLGTDVFAAFIDGWIPGAGSFFKNHAGVASHWVGFGKGVVDLRDVLYFFAAIAIFLFLNGLSLEGRFRPKAKIIFSGAVAVCFVSLVLLNWLAHDLPLGRFDLTEGQLHTVSEVTQKILKGLKVPVQAKLYISPPENLPTALKTLEREITDKLEELKVISGGKFQYRVIHLETSGQDQTLKAKLENEGVVPFQVESIQRDEVGVKIVYSTLVIEYKEKPQEILPRLVPQALVNLEYQLMSRIYKMTLEEKPKVAVFAPVKEDETIEKGYEEPFKTAVILMQNNGYEVHRIAFAKEDGILEGTKTLLLLAPGLLTDRQRYEINRFLHRGGTVILAAQGYGYTFKQEPSGMAAVAQKQNLDINKLTEKWGVKVNEDILLDESSQVISLSSGQRIGPFAFEMPIKLPNQIMVQEAMINRESSITKNIPALFYLWGSRLDIDENLLKSQGLRATTLFTSSPRSWTMPYNGTNLNVENTRPPMEDIQGKYPLAVLLEGQFSDVFGTPPPAWIPGEAAETGKMDEPKAGRLLLMGCSQAFGDELLQHPGNLNLFANAIDGLILGEDLIQIRSKTAIVRDLKVLSNAEKIWYRFLTVLLAPIVLFFAALIRHFIRRKEKEFYLTALSASGGRPASS
jgi:gliding-associated putative ABC transporter substrate-binding component GldG